MVLKEFEIIQKPTEPPRRYFTDNNHFDLFVWYDDDKFVKPAGFQLGFRETALNTDDEMVWTQRSHDKVASVRLGQIRPSNPNHPAPKVIHPSSAKIPTEFWRLWNLASIDLPPEIKAYIERFLK